MQRWGETLFQKNNQYTFSNVFGTWNILIYIDSIDVIVLLFVV